jgi:ADP-heptose:LPS heptosyltransferase
MPNRTDESSTLLVPLVAGIGNALMTEPMLRQLHCALPNAKIVALAISKPIAEVVRRIDGIDVRITGSGIKNMLKSARLSRSLKPDVYLVPFPSNRWQYNLLASLSGAKRVILHRYPKPAMGLRRFDRLDAVRGLHDVEQNLRLLTMLGIQPRFPDPPRFALTDEEHTQVAGVLEQAGIGSDYVVVHAGSARTVLAEAKRWPEASYAKLVETIRDETGRTVLIVEGPDEAGVADRIVAHIADRARIVTLPLRGSLGMSAAILAKSAFYVGTDSGLAHLAAAVGKRAITLFAPADPDRVCPFANRDLVVQPEGLTDLAFLYPWESTRPALRPGRVNDIQRITVDQVMAKVKMIGHRDTEKYTREKSK